MFSGRHQGSRARAKHGEVQCRWWGWEPRRAFAWLLQALPVPCYTGPGDVVPEQPGPGGKKCSFSRDCIHAVPTTRLSRASVAYRNEFGLQAGAVERITEVV